MATYSLGRRRVIALLLLSSIMLITLDIRGNATIDRMRSVFSVVLSPFDTAARAVSRPVVNAWRGVTEYDELVRENELLRERVAQQRGAEIEALAAILEYQELLQLNRLTGLAGYPKEVAQVQGASPSNFQYTVEISKGSNHAIAVGMPVLNGAGLVGKVTQVFPNSSIVLLVTDPSFSIGAKILTSRVVEPIATTLPPGSTLPGGVVDPDAATSTSTTSPTMTTSTTTTTTTTTTTVPGATGAGTTLPGATATTDLLTSESPDDSSVPAGTDGSPPDTATTTTSPRIEVIRETGTLRGQGPDRPLVIDFIEQSTTANNLEVGSSVETAGGATGIAPAGLPIGVVSSVDKQSGSPIPVVEVESAAGDLSRLTFVTVLLYLPNPGT